MLSDGSSYMNNKNLRNVDLNLFAALQILVEECNITRAAQRMYLSQPAMSRVVDRLQEMLKDELLIRTGQGYLPTHRALTAYTELQQVLPRLETLLQGPAFKPADSTGIFNIEATDWGATILMPKFIEILARVAPGVQIAIIPKNIGFESLERGEVDLSFAFDRNFQASGGAKSTLQTEVLFHQKLVCVVRKGHQLSKGRLTLRRYLKAQHVSLEPMQARGVYARSVPDSQGLVDDTLKRLGVRRDVRVRLPYFAPIGGIIENTDLVATVPAELAIRLKSSTTCTIRAPSEFPGFSYQQIWHRRNDSNALHKWLRGLIRKAAGQVRARSSRPQRRGNHSEVV